MCGHDNPNCPGKPCPFESSAYPSLARLLVGCKKRPAAEPSAEPVTTPKIVAIAPEAPIDEYRRLAAWI